MLIPTDTFWAVEPLRWRQMLGAVQAAEVRAGIEAVEIEREVVVIRGDVAVISVEGPLTKQPSIFTWLFGGVSYIELEAAIRQLERDPAVRTIVLRIDSPGGTVDGLAEAGDAIWRVSTKSDTRIIAQITGMAASAAYYLASQAEEIYAQRMDLVGSIGTILMLYDFSEAFKQGGIKAIPITTGKFKAAGAMGTEITDEQQAEFQRIVDAYFADFTSRVRRGRSMSGNDVRAVADGRIFLADESVRLGLVDGIRTLDETLGKLRSRKARNVQTQQLAELSLDSR